MIRIEQHVGTKDKHWQERQTNDKLDAMDNSDKPTTLLSSQEFFKHLQDKKWTTSVEKDYQRQMNENID